MVVKSLIFDDNNHVKAEKGTIQLIFVKGYQLISDPKASECELSFYSKIHLLKGKSEKGSYSSWQI